MLKRSKIAVALTAALLCAMPMAVSAADEKEPVVIVTDKSEYAGTDEVKESIVITNTTGAEATNVTVKVDVPKGLMEKGTKIEEQIVKQYEKLAAGESTQLDITLVKSTQSGDSAKVLLWVGLAAVGVAGFVALSRKKNLKGAMSVLMVVAMVATLVPANPQNVEAASTTKKATKEITVAGEKVKLSVSVVFNDERLLTLGANMLKNASGSSMGSWENSSAVASGHTMSVKNGAIEYVITDVGANDYDVQLKQMGLKLEKDATYVVSFDAKSTETRTIKANVMNGTYVWYGGTGVELTKGKTQNVEFEFTMTAAEANAGLFLSLGQMFDEVYDENGELESKTKIDTAASTITLSNFKFAKKVPAEYTAKAPVTVTIPTKEETTTEVNLLDETKMDLVVADYDTGAATMEVVDGKFVIDVTALGKNDYAIKFMQQNVELEGGAKYVLTFNAKSTETRDLNVVLMTPWVSEEDPGEWYGGSTVNLVKDTEKAVTIDIATWNENEEPRPDANNIDFSISMGQYGDNCTTSKITLSDFKLVKVEEPSTEEPSTEEPSTEETSTEEPSTEEPSTEEPSTEEPTVTEKIVVVDFEDDSTSIILADGNVNTDLSFERVTVANSGVLKVLNALGTDPYNNRIGFNDLGTVYGKYDDITFDIIVKDEDVAGANITVQLVFQSPANWWTNAIAPQTFISDSFESLGNGYSVCHAVFSLEALNVGSDEALGHIQLLFGADQCGEFYIDNIGFQK